MIPAILALPIWIIAFIVLFVFILAVFLLVFWIWAIIDCLSSKLSTAEKLFWIIVILIFNLLGALFYFIFSRLTGGSVMKSKNLKGKRLLRSKKNRMIAGVCGGIGEYFEIDPTVIRLLWVLLSIFSMGAGILAYIIAWIIVPER